MMDDSRLQPISDEPADAKGQYVLYWMQASQRAVFNHALEYAVGRANRLKLPVLVCFGLMDDYPEANERHYAFMLEGLADVAKALKTRGIQFVVKHGNPPDVALHYAKRAAIVVCDRGYLRHQRQWRDDVADHAGREVVQVEGDVIVPVETVSDHDEFAARTIRPRIKKHLETFLTRLTSVRLAHKSLTLKITGDIDVTDVDHALKKLKIDRSVPRVFRFTGGHAEARKHLDRFVRNKLGAYGEGRNEPAAEGTSTMSPYLHFGQISPVEIALAARRARRRRIGRRIWRS